MADKEKEILPEEQMTENETLAANVAEEATTSEENKNEEGTSELLMWKDRYMRLFAEFDNYKKRTSKEMSEVIKTAGKDVMIGLLDVMDDSQRALKQMETANDIQAVKEGVVLVLNKLQNTLHAKGLKSFDSIGHEFDVEKHEAITEIPAPTPEMEGKVIDEIHKGYYLNDKLIRHAKVVVGKSTSA